MSQFNNGAITLTAGAALEKYRRVKLTGDRTVGYAGAGEKGIGFNRDAVASGDLATIVLDNKEGTFKAVAAGAITQNAVLYGAADGKVDDAVSGTALGVALDAAAADGEIIEVLAIGDPS